MLFGMSVFIRSGSSWAGKNDIICRMSVFRAQAAGRMGGIFMLSRSATWLVSVVCCVAKRVFVPTNITGYGLGVFSRW